jgi:hypothetical protein
MRRAKWIAQNPELAEALLMCAAHGVSMDALRDHYDLMRQEYSERRIRSTPAGAAPKDADGAE